jgi:hypothetical protein
LDEDKRKQAKLTIQNAKHLSYWNPLTKKESLAAYLEGIHLFSQIIHKTHDDLMALSSAYEDMAIIFFNLANYTSSAEYYLLGINTLLLTELNDDTYRLLTERYVSLADACYELSYQEHGNEAMGNAIKAFTLIQNKNSQEQNIGDPSVNLNQFYQYIENKTSTEFYLSSSRFTHYESLLNQGKREKRQENKLFRALEGKSMSEVKQTSDNIDQMLEALSLNTKEKPLFNPVFLKNNQNTSETKPTITQHASQFGGGFFSSFSQQQSDSISMDDVNIEDNMHI